MRREVAYLFLIVAVAFTARVYAPWRAVFGDGDHVNFLETDAWYHVRLIENQARNWPWRVTLDPYAAPGGQFVPIAPLFDTITSTLVVVLHGRGASTSEVEATAAFVPPVLGVLTILVLWALARRVFDRRAALLGAALLAVLPGHFLDRTLLGFYDHHALEALLAMAVLSAVASGREVALGLTLGLYLLGWSSGAFLVGILGVWLLLLVPLAQSAEELSRAARAAGAAALVAFILVVVFQDPRMHRSGSQIVSLAALAAMALAIRVIAVRGAVAPLKRPAVYAGMALVLAIGGAVVWWIAPGVIAELVIDVRRLAPDPTRMAVLEARPLFLYPGTWNWQQPWEFFRTGFVAGLIGLVAFTWRVVSRRAPIDLAIWVFTAAMFAATLGQNRFGYYLMPACALVGGWLAARILDWGGVPPGAPRGRGVPLQREVALVIVAGGMFAPNLVPAVLMASRAGTFPAHWRDAMAWLREHTPEPFTHSASAGGEYYYARYPRLGVPPPDYSIMNWWDHGYWVVQAARRVPVANPTQARAPNAARFYASTDEQEAVGVLIAERARYALVDWELPFRLTPDGVVMGRFQNVLDWSGAEHARYYEVYYRRERNAWTPVWVFHQPYYQSMAYRLMVLGGARATPANATTVLAVADRADDSGMRFKEILSQATYPSYDAAIEAARQAPNGRALVVGLDPWRPAFPLDGLIALREAHQSRTPGQPPDEAPWVRVFELK